MIACIKCKWHDDGWGNNCSNEALQKPDPLHGALMTSCSEARAEGGKCGPEAKLFEKRFFARLFA